MKLLAAGLLNYFVNKGKLYGRIRESDGFNVVVRNGAAVASAVVVAPLFGFIVVCGIAALGKGHGFYFVIWNLASSFAVMVFVVVFLAFLSGASFSGATTSLRGIWLCLGRRIGLIAVLAIIALIIALILIIIIITIIIINLNAYTPWLQLLEKIMTDSTQTTPVLLQCVRTVSSILSGYGKRWGW